MLVRQPLNFKPLTERAIVDKLKEKEEEGGGGEEVRDLEERSSSSTNLFPFWT